MQHRLPQNSHGANFDLQITAESQQNRSVSEADPNRGSIPESLLMMKCGSLTTTSSNQLCNQITSQKLRKGHNRP